MSSRTHMLFTGWEVRIRRNWARGLEHPSILLPIRTDLGRWITSLFFSHWDLKVSGNFTLASKLCVEVGRVCVDEDTAIRLLQTVSIASEISLCGNFANSNFRPGEISQVRIFDVAKFRGCEFSLRRNFGKTKVTFASVDAKFQQDESEISLG